MLLKTLNRRGGTVLKDYSASEYRSILAEKNCYVLKRVHSYGDDYGGSQHSEETVTSYEEITPEQMLVRDGHFCGVSIIEDFDCYNGGSKFTLRDAKLLISGKQGRSVRCGEDFSNDDHSRWDYVDFYLVKRPE